VLVPPSSPIVVCIAFPLAVGHAETERLRELDPRIELAVAPYIESSARRAARDRMSEAELRDGAPPVDDAVRAALAEAEVVFALDAPVGLATMAPRLSWLHTISAGVEHLRGCELRGREIVVTNSSGVAAPSIAEYVIGRLLMVWKRFPEQAELQASRTWSLTYGRLLAGSTIAIVGIGAIGSEVARLAKAFHATVLGLRRTQTPTPHVDELYPPSRLHEMLGRADAVVIAAPGSEDTRHLIDAQALAAMKPGAMLVNIARGSLVDESALAEALRSGHLAAAALDVFETEPLPAESPLWSLANCYVSAHSSVSLDRYVEDVLAIFADNLRRYVAGEPLRNIVEAPP